MVYGRRIFGITGEHAAKNSMFSEGSPLLTRNGAVGRLLSGILGREELWA